MEISYLTYQQIDKKKWDACIRTAGNGLIYAYSFYLDTMAKNWDALVLSAESDGNDYEAVMPLTWNRKYGIHYLYQPPFTACLGVFGKTITAETVNHFLLAIPKKFKYWDIYFNPGNLFKVDDFNLYQRMNFVLPLNSNYKKLSDTYRENTKRNIKKSEQYQLKINRNIDIHVVIGAAKEQVAHFSVVTEDDYSRFAALYNLLYQQSQATTYGVFTKEEKLIASAVFFFSNGRAYYILVGNLADGKTLGASHALINAFIKDHAGEDLLLDFEGSDVPSLAFFYSSFGAVEEKYSAVRLNRLPTYLKWMKKS